MAINGCNTSLSLGTNEVAGLNNISNPINKDTLDVTVFNTDCVRDFIAGLTNGTISISGFYESGDADGQVALMTAFLAGTKLTGAQKPVISWDGTNGITADALVSSLTIDSTVEGTVNFSATLQLSGVIAVV